MLTLMFLGAKPCQLVHLLALSLFETTGGSLRISLMWHVVSSKATSRPGNFFVVILLLSKLVSFCLGFPSGCTVDLFVCSFSRMLAAVLLTEGQPSEARWVEEVFPKQERVSYSPKKRCLFIKSLRVNNPPIPPEFMEQSRLTVTVASITSLCSYVPVQALQDVKDVAHMACNGPQTSQDWCFRARLHPTHGSYDELSYVRSQGRKKQKSLGHLKNPTSKVPN